jgi:hypothetical protein
LINIISLLYINVYIFWKVIIIYDQSVCLFLQASYLLPINIQNVNLFRCYCYDGCIVTLSYYRVPRNVLSCSEERIIVLRGTYYRAPRNVLSCSEELKHDNMLTLSYFRVLSWRTAERNYDMAQISRRISLLLDYFTVIKSLKHFLSHKGTWNLLNALTIRLLTTKKNKENEQTESSVHFMYQVRLAKIKLRIWK